VTDLNRLFKWLAILSTLIALFVFLLSVVSPFYNWESAFLEPSGGTFWSYKANYSSDISGIFSESQSWFLNYWFNANSLEMGWTPWIPLVLVAMQALISAFGCASLAINRRIIRSVPVCSSLTALVLMSLVGYGLASSNGWGAGYQLGYYLVYPSVALFAIALALTEVRVRYLQSRYQPIFDKENKLPKT
jgi:hypothetical protein